MATEQDVNEFFRLIKLAEKNIEEGNKQQAIIAVRTAILMCNPNESQQFYIKQFRVIFEREMAISVMSPANYWDFLYYFILDFIMEQIEELLRFPYLQSFYHNEKRNRMYAFDERQSGAINKVLRNIQREAFKQGLVESIMVYTFQGLPELFGIPEKYRHPDITTIYKNDKEYNEMADFRDAWKNQPFHKLTEILDFASDLVKKCKNYTNE